MIETRQQNEDKAADRDAAKEYIRRQKNRRNGFRALRKAKRFSNPITHEELIRIARVWVEAALALTPRDLRMIDRLVSRQGGRFS